MNGEQQTKEKGFGVDDVAKVLAIIAVAASVLGYLVISKWLYEFGISEPSIISTKMAAAGLLCLTVFVGPSLAVFCCMAYFKSLSVPTFWDKRHSFWQLTNYNPQWQTWTSQLGTCMFLALGLSVFVSSSGAVAGMDSLSTFGLRMSLLCLVLFLLSFVSTHLFFHARITGWWLPAGMTVILVVLISVILCHSYLTLHRHLIGASRGGVPLAHILKYSLPAAFFSFLSWSFSKTKCAVFPYTILLGFTCYLPIYAADFYGFLKPAAGGGSPSPVSVELSIVKQGTPINVERLGNVRIFFQTDTNIYFQDCDGNHDVHQVQKSSVYKIDYLRSRKIPSPCDPPTLSKP